MDLKILCKNYGLNAVPKFWETSELRLREIYNGAGPDWLPDWGRKILTSFLKIFKGAFVIHDFDYERSDKSLPNFNAANDRMLSNMMKILDKDYPFSSILKWPARARWWVRAKAAYKACEKFGWPTWLN
ncbi:MAG: hypothetical protein A2020_00650 [Lentisphaerae bacterium GWF2_45_14]|nr:MAG: hypothetical protein A2020_00650 [Lentisphaerae bacterium GWF2_45_14]